jgi:DNA/RNA-binding domain of Phe-tRNA-synthetase-like protein
MLNINENFLLTYPSALIGFLVMRDVENLTAHPALEACKQELESELRLRFADKEAKILDNTHPLPAYTAYYKRFDKTYHVLGQLKSIIYKNKPIPSVASLVESMFIAELKNGLLTAGHDLDLVKGSLSINVSNGDEHFTLMRGEDQQLKSGDLYIADKQGILSTIIYGPDQRTQITSTTKNALFTVYAPNNISYEEVEKHLLDIRDLVLLVTPNAVEDTFQIIGR